MREKFLQIAESQVGVQEPNGDDKYIQWYNSQTGAGFPMNTPWCQIFVCWCADQAGVSREVIPLTASCTAAMNWFIRDGVWHARGTFRPQPGDLVYFDWDLSGDCDHVGIVQSVSGSSFTTIEGNASGSGADGVRRKSYALDYSRIRGFAAPRFPSGEDEKNKPSPWAEEACRWAVEEGLFIGDQDGVIDWQGTLHKEDLAVVLHRYYEKFR